MAQPKPPRRLWNVVDKIVLALIFLSISAYLATAFSAVRITMR